MPVERLNRLEKIGFDWDPIETLWQKNFQELKAYKDEFGDCKVPARWSINPQLGGWVSRQRSQNKRNKLSGDRVSRLDDLGFEWGPNKN